MWTPSSTIGTWKRLPALGCWRCTTRSNRKRNATYAYMSVRWSGEIDKSVEEHSETVRAIRAGDGDAAQRAVEENWRNAADRFVKVIDALGERGSW